MANEKAVSVLPYYDRREKYDVPSHTRGITYNNLSSKIISSTRSYGDGLLNSVGLAAQI